MSVTGGLIRLFKVSKTIYNSYFPRRLFKTDPSKP